MAYKARKRKVKKNVPEGKAFIHSTFNNTIVTLTDKEGNAISWASAGTLGIKGSKKSTPFAAGQAAEAAGRAAYDMGSFQNHGAKLCSGSSDWRCNNSKYCRNGSVKPSSARRTRRTYRR